MKPRTDSSENQERRNYGASHGVIALFSRREANSTNQEENLQHNNRELQNYKVFALYRYAASLRWNGIGFKISRKFLIATVVSQLLCSRDGKNKHSISLHPNLQFFFVKLGITELYFKQTIANHSPSIPKTTV